MVYQAPLQLNIADYFLFDRLREGMGGRLVIRTDSGSWTYDQLAALALSYGSRLRQRGVAPEQHVIVALPDGPDYAGALFGILAIGAVVVMINPELRPDHLAAILTAARAPAAVVGEEYTGLMEAAISLTPHPPELMIVGGPSLPQPAMSAPDTFPTHRDDPAVWLFSGGTTGVPKIVVQTHRAFANTTELYAKATMGYGPDDVTIAVPRLYFGYATGSALFFPMAVGASTVLFDARPTPAVLFEQIARHRPTILVTAPSAINAMLADTAAADLTSLRFATSAGEALPETLYHRWMDRFGVALLDGLGTAEMWHIFITNRPGQVVAGTVGQVVAGFEIKACDEEGVEVEPNEVGRLWVRGDSLALGYWHDLDQTTAAFRGEWFVGGDLVSIDRAGYVTHRGRADDAIKVKGKWFRPQDVESVLLEHPAVKECAVVVVEDADGLQKPVAFVVTRAEVSEDELQRHVLDHLEPYKHPRRVLFLDTLPQTHLGKIDRGRLKAMVSAL